MNTAENTGAKFEYTEAATKGSLNHTSAQSSTEAQRWWYVRDWPVSFRCRLRADLKPTPHGQNITIRVTTSHKYLKAITKRVNSGLIAVTLVSTSNDESVVLVVVLVVVLLSSCEYSTGSGNEMIMW